MFNLRRLFLALVLLLPCVARAADDSKPSRPVRVLLLGDSTCIGSVCRIVAPHADHLEQIIEKLLAAEKDLPPVEVLNKARDGQWVQQLLESGFYDREVAPLKNIDFVLMRFGANDRARCKDFTHDFPRDYRNLFGRLRKDYPHATLVMVTMLPILGTARNKEVNDIARGLATDEKLPLLDIEPRYAAELKAGPNMLNYRRMPLEKIPERYRSLVADMTVKDFVVVLDNRLDAHLKDVPGWFGDRHPNLAGYHVIGDETAKFLAPLIRQAKRP